MAEKLNGYMLEQWPRNKSIQFIKALFTSISYCTCYALVIFKGNLQSY
jgi:hypothetical protein